MTFIKADWLQVFQHVADVIMLDMRRQMEQKAGVCVCVYVPEFQVAMDLGLRSFVCVGMSVSMNVWCSYASSLRQA